MNDRLREGRQQAERVARAFSWTLRGYGYPGEPVSFTWDGMDFQLPKQAMTALLAWIDGGKEKR